MYVYTPLIVLQEQVPSIAWILLDIPLNLEPTGAKPVAFSYLFLHFTFLCCIYESDIFSSAECHE